MSRITSFWRNLLRRGHVERDLDDELRSVFEMLVEAHLEAGMTADEARRAARLKLGSREAIKDQVRDVRAGASVDRLARDLRYALRGLVKHPGTSLALVITFALGSAGVTATFALVNAILLQPLPYPDSERLVAVKHAAPGLALTEAGLSSGTYFHYRAHAQAFETLAVYSETVLNLSSPDTGTERVAVAYAGPELFAALKTRPIVGRLFTAEDGRPGFANMTWPIPVLLSHELWQRRYGGAPDIVGRTITLNDRPRPVVGVLPQGFAFPRVETEIWMLFMPTGGTSNFARDLDYSAVARLRPGVTAAAAAAELQRILPSIEGVYADATAARLAEVQLTPIVVPLKEALVGDVRPLLLLLFGGMAVLLLVACANTANLSLLRAEHRQREMAVRTALGARTGDLVRLFVSEAALVSATGAALGLWLADLALNAIVLFAPVRLPRLSEVTLDVWVLAFTCGLAALGAVLFGGLSFLGQSVLTSPAASLKGSAGTTADGRRLRMRDVLVAVQVALALMLLAGSALMVQSFWRLTRVDPGFESAGVLTVGIGLPGRRASQHQQIYDGLLQRVSALPGVRGASAASSLPLESLAYAYPLSIDDAPAPTELPIAMKFIMPGYFQVMNIPVIEGTGFAHNDRANPPDGVIISAALARRRFPGQSPIGRHILRREPDGTAVSMFDGAAGAARPLPPWTIVGVVADVRETSLRADPTEMVYLPVRQPAVERSITPTSMSLVIRSDVPPASLAGVVRHAIREADAALSVARIRPMDAIVTTSIASERFLAGLLLVAAAVSLLLSAIGVYGVAAQTVRRREHEIGIRMSLGAGPREVVGMVLTRSTAFILIGAAAGLAAALAATRALAAFLFQVRPTDPLVLGMVTALLIAVAVIAVLVPACRAVRLDPLSALRRE